MRDNLLITLRGEEELGRFNPRIVNQYLMCEVTIRGDLPEVWRKDRQAEIFLDDPSECLRLTMIAVTYVGVVLPRSKSYVVKGAAGIYSFFPTPHKINTAPAYIVCNPHAQTVILTVWIEKEADLAVCRKLFFDMQEDIEELLRESKRVREKMREYLNVWENS